MTVSIQTAVYVNGDDAPESKRALHTWLAALGSRPLGDELGTLKGVVHGALEFACLLPSNPLHARAMHGHGPVSCSLWARRRWIALAGQRMLLQEVFLAE